MKRFHLSEIPFELRLEHSAAYFVVDNDTTMTIGELKVLQHGESYEVKLEGASRPAHFTSLSAALHSIDPKTEDFDLPDELFEQLHLRAVHR